MAGQCSLVMFCFVEDGNLVFFVGVAIGSGFQVIEMRFLFDARPFRISVLL